MKVKEKFNKLPHKKLVVIALIVIAIVGLGWLGHLWYKSVTVNYAEEVARPIEEGLVGGRSCPLQQLALGRYLASAMPS